MSNYKNLPDEPVDHALGRSRGGWTTKIHALIDASCAPLTVTLTPGQAGDNPQLASLLTRHSRNGARDFRLLADKAYSHDSTRNYLRQRRIPHTIPERSDQIARRQAKGSHGGRPPSFDPTTYRQRNTVERGFNRLKHWMRRGHPLRQVRPDIPRRSHPRRRHHLPPHPQLTDTA